MTPLPAALGGGELVAWRLSLAVHDATWDLGEGAYRDGGRWNSPGIRAVYCALDPATSILEVAVHTGFRTLDTVAHTLTSLTIDDPASVHVVDPSALPNPHWLHPGTPSPGQQAFGDALLASHRFVVFPSVVSSRSWNLVFVATRATGAYRLRAQERFALDTRFHPAT